MNKTKALLVLNSEHVDLVYPPHLRQILDRDVDFIAPPQTAQSLQTHPQLLKEVEVIFSSWGMLPLDESMLADAPNLKVIFYGAGSIRYFTSDAFWRRGIRVTSAYHVNGEFVANLTLAQILLSLKGYWEYTRQYRQHKQTFQRFPIASMYKSKVGLISLGAIGCKVVELLKPFDVEIIAYDPFWQTQQAKALGVSMAALDTVFSTADVISLHTPWLPETVGMITAEHFRAMKPHSTFINTARGAVVREQEMIQVLRERPDLTALLDVTYPEPPEPNSPLFQLPNVILSPHIAGAMDREIEKMGALMVDEFQRWLAGDTMMFEIDEERSRRLA